MPKIHREKNSGRSPTNSSNTPNELPVPYNNTCIEGNKLPNTKKTRMLFKKRLSCKDEFIIEGEFMLFQAIKYVIRPIIYEFAN